MIRVEYLALKSNGQEQLLYEQNYNVMEFNISWPDPALFFTNNFQTGSEHVRLSGFEDYDFVFDNTVTSELIFVQTPYTDGVCIIPDKNNHLINIQENMAFTPYSDQQESILEHLIAIREEIEGGSII